MYEDKEQLHEIEWVIFYEKEAVTCGRKEKQENEIGENLSLEKRKREKRPARRRNSPEMKDNNPDKLR